MATVKYNIELNYITKGLEAAQQNLKTLLPKVGKTDQEFIAKMQERISTLSTFIPKEGAKISVETQKLVTKQYNEILSDIANKLPKITGIATKAVSDSLSTLNMQIEERNTKLTAFLEHAKEINKIAKFDESGKATLRPAEQRKVFAKLSQDKGFQASAVSERKDIGVDVTQFVAYTDKLRDAKKLNEDIVYNEREKNALAARAQYDAKIQNELLNVEKDYRKTNKNIAESQNWLQQQRVEYEKRVNELTKINESDSEDVKQAKELIKKILQDTLRLQTENNEKQKESVKIDKQKIDETEKFTKKIEEQGRTFGKTIKNVLNYGVVIQGLRRIYRETIKTITELDKSLTQMTVVTTMSRKAAWNLIPTLQNLAKETGFTTTEVAGLTTEYLKQGKTLSDALILTEAAAKAARIAGISASESVTYLTAAINGFSLSAEDAIKVSDKFAALAAASATDYEELAVGLSKFASQANLAGLSMNFALGLLAKGVETTREAPESIGTALKTVLARMRELTDLGKTLEDGMDLNRVETALKQVGIRLRDTTGQFRDMESVLTEVGQQWETLNKNQQASVAVALAGTRQQSRLIAMFQDFDRTLELVDISMNSEGATMAQHSKYMKSMEAAMIGLQTAWQQFITTITESQVIIGIVKTITQGIKFLSNTLNFLGISGKNAMIVMGLLLVALKSYSIYQKIANSNTVIALILQTLFNKAKKEELKTTLLGIGAKIKENILNAAIKIGLIQKTSLTIAETTATKAATSAQWAWNASLLANPIFWVIAALAGLIITIVAIEAAQKKHIKQLKEEIEQLKIRNYEIQKSTKSLKELADQIEEINNKPIKLDIDRKNLDETWQAVLEMEKELGVTLTVERFGEKDLQATLINIANFIAEKEKEIGTNLQIIIKDTVHLYNAGTKQIEEVSKAYSDSIGYNIQLSGRALSTHEKNFIEKYIGFKTEIKKWDIKNNGDTEAIYKDFYDSASSSLEEFAKFEKQITQYTYISEQTAAYAALKTEIENLNDSSLIRAFEETYSVLGYMSKNYTDSLGVGLDTVFNKFNLLTDEIKNMSIAFEEAGYDYTTVMAGIIERTNQIIEGDQTIDHSEAAAIAFSEAASGMENSRLALLLYEKTSTQTTLKTTQNIDAINSAITRVSETQDKFLKGDITKSDLYQFIEEQPGLFAQEGILEKFLLGEDVSINIIQSWAKEQQELKNQLIGVNSELEKLAGKTDEVSNNSRKELLITKAQIVSAMQYDGVLKGLSQTQYDYNNILLAYQRLSELNIDNMQMTSQMITLLQEQTIENLLTSDNKIERSADTITEKLGKEWTKYAEIINGIAVVNTDTYKSLSDEQKKYIDSFINTFNFEATNVYNTFKTLRDTILAEEQKAADKKKKIYEDYFAALDKLEEKREREQSREDIVKQLQRLEGATDERSRQKAKELRADLIQMDKDYAKQEKEDYRESIIKGIDESVVKVEKKFSTIWDDFIKAGGKSGEELIAVLRKEGLLGNAQTGTYTPIIPNETSTIATSGTSGQGFFSNIFQTAKTIFGNKTSAPNAEAQPEPEIVSNEKLEAYKIFMRTLYEDPMSRFSFSAPGWDTWLDYWDEKGMRISDFNDIDKIYSYIDDRGLAQIEHLYSKTTNETFDTWLSSQGKYLGLPGYRKGGLVTYTGPAMVHGSSSSPEAFLNANQTALFANLRDALVNLSVNKDSSSIQIDNITIQTQSLNNNLDFKTAGQTLAEAFSSAITRRGLNLNTKR